MESFPAFFPLKGARVVIAGEGEMAEGKARLFDGSPARVNRLAGEAALDPAAYEGASLVFVAHPDPEFRRAAAAAARTAGAPVNVVDDPPLCDFYTPALINRGGVVIAVGTSGASPLLAGLLRDLLDAHTPAGVGPLAGLLAGRREEIRAAFPDLAERAAFLRAWIEGAAGQAALAGDLAGADGSLLASLAAAGGESSPS